MAASAPDADWTLTLVRTDLGREIITRMVDEGVIEAKPGDSDPAAIELMGKLAERSAQPLADIGRGEHPGRRVRRRHRALSPCRDALQRP